MSATQQTSIFVDNSLDTGDYQPEVKVSGELDEAKLSSPSGKHFKHSINISIIEYFCFLQVILLLICLMIAALRHQALA